MIRQLSLSFSILMLVNTAFAHDGPHDDVEYLPKYRDIHQQGSASLRVTKVQKNYIVTFSSPQFNFVGSDKEKLNATNKKQISSILKDLKKVSSLFNSEQFECKELIGNSNSIAKHRVGEPNLREKYKGKKVELKNFIQPFVEISSYYKINCKKEIDHTKISYNIFKIAPNLKTIHWKFNDEKNKIKTLIIRPSPKVNFKKTAKPTKAKK